MTPLDAVRGGLIISCQAEAESPLNEPHAIALLARIAERSGAVAVRIEGAARIAAVRAAVGLPIVGIVKRVHPGFAPYITSTRREIDEAVDAGARIVAFDATPRARVLGDDVAALIAYAHARGAVAMADCADADDGRIAAAAGAGILATTLAGYTEATAGRPLPALDLVAALAPRHPFVVCEGGVSEPGDVARAFAAGAAAVVVGTAITNVDVLARRFVARAPRTAPPLI